MGMQDCPQDRVPGEPGVKNYGGRGRRTIETRREEYSQWMEVQVQALHRRWEFNRCPEQQNLQRGRMVEEFGKWKLEGGRWLEIFTWNWQQMRGRWDENPGGGGVMGLSTSRSKRRSYSLNVRVYARDRNQKSSHQKSVRQSMGMYTLPSTRRDSKQISRRPTDRMSEKNGGKQEGRAVGGRPRKPTPRTPNTKRGESSLGLRPHSRRLVTESRPWQCLDLIT